MIKSTKLSTMTALAKEFIEQGEWVLGTIGHMSKAQTKELNTILTKVLKPGVE